MPTQPITAQSLGAMLKSARDIMRIDKGRNVALDRLDALIPAIRDRAFKGELLG